MPTYKFICTTCKIEWNAHQSIHTQHESLCPQCNQSCPNVAFGGNGFRFSGKHLNQRLRGFPDNSRKINQEADDLAKEYEQADTYMHKGIDAATKAAATEVSEKKRANRSTRFRPTK